MGKHGHGEGSTAGSIIGSATAGASELMLFHPVDTIAKRLMSNTEIKIFGGTDPALTSLSKIVFKKHHGAPILKKYGSLFPGLGWAAGYKILQRVYKFGGQPYIQKHFTSNFGHNFDNWFGKNSKSMLAATSGALVGMGEVILLPLDVLKIKSQTNPEALKGRGIADIFLKEGRNLYRGTTWTMARNAPGSFALFGASAYVKQKVFHLEDFSKASLFQTTVASTAGAIASITVAAPLDTIKTRIQNKPFDSPESGVSIVKNLFKNEGPMALFKGLTPKIVVVGPKLIFSMTVAQYIIANFDRWLGK